MSATRLARVVIGVTELADASRVFAERLELPGGLAGGRFEIPIGASRLELSEEARPLGLARVILRSDDLAATAQRLEAHGAPFVRRSDGSLELGGETTHGVTLEIRGA